MDCWLKSIAKSTIVSQGRDKSDNINNKLVSKTQEWLNIWSVNSILNVLFHGRSRVERRCIRAAEIISEQDKSVFDPNPRSICSFYTNNLQSMKILSIVFRIFIDNDPSDPKRFIPHCLIVIVSGTAFSIFSIAFQIIYYKSKRTFMKWTLYVNKLVFDLVTPLLLFPSATFTGISFNLTQEEKSSGFNWLYFFVGILCYPILFIIFYIGVSMTSKSSSLPPLTSSLRNQNDAVNRCPEQLLSHGLKAPSQTNDLSD